MGKTGKWIRSFLAGKKDKDKDNEKINASKTQNQDASSTAIDQHIPTTPIAIPPTTPREKKRWSFRRSSASAPGQREFHKVEQPRMAFLEDENHDQKKHAMAMEAATAAAADAATAAAKAAATVIQLTAAAAGRTSAIQEVAATKIQSVFRAYLARKALNALKGLVKLQALVRGHLVRKQATATLRCMQALVTAQERARIQRIQMVQESNSNNNMKQFSHRKSTQENWSSHSYHDHENGMEENIKIVEMDIGDSKTSTKSRHSYSTNGGNAERLDQKILTHRAPPKPEQIISPSPSLRTDHSPRACSAHFEDYLYATAQSSPQCYSSKPDAASAAAAAFGYARSEYGDSLYNDYPFYPSYMANTKSSRAKVRSHSAPKQRPESFERQPSATRRRPSIEGRNLPRAVKMQRSSSHVGSGAQGYQYPWSIKLDRSAISLKDSECGSTSTVMTNNNYCRSLVGFEVHGSRY